MKWHFHEDEYNEWSQLATRLYIAKMLEQVAKLDEDGNVLDGNGNVVGQSSGSIEWESF